MFWDEFIVKKGYLTSAGVYFFCPRNSWDYIELMKHRFCFTHYKENNIRNIFRVLMFQQFLVYKHQRLRDSMSDQAEA